ncbi:MAG: MgtC/SapB family protein, partial [Rhizobiaceae bacterium]
MDTDLPIVRLAIALSIGLIIGLERGWRTRTDDDHQRAAGLRTFALSGLLGGLAGMLSQQLGGVVLGLAFLGYSAAFTAFHWLEARAEQNLSATSVVAGMATFMLGALAVVGDLTATIAGA